MRYLVICKTLDDEILDWKEISRGVSDNAAVMEAFAFGTSVDDTDIVEILGEYETGICMVCQIRF